MKLYKLQILAGQAGSGHHCISVSCTSVGRCAAKIGSSITPGRKEISHLSAFICLISFLKLWQLTRVINEGKLSMWHLPSSNDSVLGSEAVNRPVLHAQSDHSFTLSVFHEQVQGKVLHKVTGVVTKRLNRRREGRHIHEMQFNSTLQKHWFFTYEKSWRKDGEHTFSHLPVHRVYAVASVLSCLLHSSSGGPGLLFHTWDSVLRRPSGRSSHLQCGWTACQSSPAG